jgi:hypothetical protein
MEEAVVYRPFKITKRKSFIRQALSGMDRWVSAGSDFLEINRKTHFVRSELVDFLRQEHGIMEFLISPERLTKLLEGLRTKEVARNQVCVFYRRREDA